MVVNHGAHRFEVQYQGRKYRVCETREEAERVAGLLIPVTVRRGPLCPACEAMYQSYIRAAIKAT